MKKLYVMIILSLLPTLVATAANLPIATFAKQGLNGWQPKTFAGETAYQLVQEDGQTVLKAQSKATASGLFYEQSIDLTETPWLNWRWKIEQPLSNLDEHSKAGDDYAARLYVVIDGGLYFWKSLALSYVWSSSQQKGAIWDNAYTDNAKMLAVQGQDDKSGIWHQNKRNVLKDLQSAFGEDLTRIDAVALMTDTDNSQSQATAWYGDIYFSAE